MRLEVQSPGEGWGRAGRREENGVVDYMEGPGKEMKAQTFSNIVYHKSSLQNVTQC